MGTSTSILLSHMVQLLIKHFHIGAQQARVRDLVALVADYWEDRWAIVRQAEKQAGHQKLSYWSNSTEPHSKKSIIYKMPQ